MESASSRATWAQQAVQVSRGPAASAGSRYLGRGGSLACYRAPAARGARPPRARPPAGACARIRAAGAGPWRGKAPHLLGELDGRLVGVLAGAHHPRAGRRPARGPPLCSRDIARLRRTRPLPDSTPLASVRQPGGARPARERACGPKHQRGSAAVQLSRRRRSRRSAQTSAAALTTQEMCRAWVGSAAPGPGPPWCAPGQQVGYKVRV